MARRTFPTTRLSAVQAVRSEDVAERERALAVLLEMYWKPAYKYLRLSRGVRPADAEDLVQGFFAKLLEKEWLADYEPARGSFRTFLRVCLDAFSRNEYRDAQRQRRSPGAPLLSLDFTTAEGEVSLDVAGGADPEEVFRREWVRSLFQWGVERLREELLAKGREGPFRLFVRYDLEGEGQERSYRDLAGELGLPVTTVTNHLALARREFRRIVLERLRELTGSEKEFREEARAVLGIEP